MLNLMQNYGIFTKIIVLQELLSKEAKRVRKKCLILTKARRREGREIEINAVEMT